MKNINIITKIISLFTLILIVLVFSECKEDYLEEQPKSELSESIFWTSQDKAKQALMGCYRGEKMTGWWNQFNGWNIVTMLASNWTGISSAKLFASSPFPQGGIRPTSDQIEGGWGNNGIWNYNYMVISRCNYFLDNIDKVDMNEEQKAEWTAEVKFLRAYAYFWLSQLFGNVPLTKTTVTFDEANSIGQSSQEEVVNFAISELTEAAEDLPLERPSAERGRIEKGAALALKGRFLMAQKQWSKAADTYKEIMDLNRYTIDPRFKALFEDEGDNSDEIIFARKYMQTEFGQPMSIQDSPPSWLGYYGQVWFLQNFIDKFLMDNGETIEEAKASGYYDSDNPFENRDPRLYATAFLPGYTKIKASEGYGGSTIYQGHPDSIALTGQSGPGVTGYGVRKWYDSEYSGDTWTYGGDYPLIRYAEVLFSRLESELRAGNSIDQSLLDETVNKVRERDSVDMPPVVKGEDFNSNEELMNILRRERCVELAMEGMIRYWDLVRWEKLDEVLNRRFYGMKVTDNPSGYEGKYQINEEGHIYIREKVFHEHNYLWPIPQSELDVNENLEQNPGY